MTENLANFTDILGDEDEISDSQQSQPLSLPSSTDSHPQVRNNEPNKIIRPAKGTGQFKEFRSVEEIDTKYREVFSYPYFNLVQSRVIEDALYSDKSLVVCAPTGSGKTVVFEMAIVQLLMEMENNNSAEDFKIIYMAPVKALCTERLTEWYSKFTRLGLLCIEVTGDTDVDFTQLQAYKIIITTPEKWDMLTRRWKDHRGLVEMIKLFLIDEVHILNDETRGPVLEAVVSRMKTVQSAAQSAHRIEQLQKQYQNISEDGREMNPNKSENGHGIIPKADNTAPMIRFVAVSATVSNPEDVAAWLNTEDKPAVYYKFGDECRPVKLRRVVEGYPCPDGTSIFKFDIILNYKLWPIIQKYHDGKPTLIFCNTRKSVLLTAETLSKEITITFSPEQKAKLTALASTIKTKKLQSLVLAGVGCHHAGMLYEERIYIEHAFRNGDLPILITTTTLAMGVNLPAHLVIIKNTQQYVNGAYQEYSISTVLQMVGRAGRPQFDTEATAVIMTRQRDKARYQALAGGSEPLQSYLHKRLAENLNSETALGTVCDVAQCVQWLRSTFLYVRAAKDPKKYLGLTSTAPEYLILKKIEELCVRAMNGLASAGLISMDEASCIESTEAGRLMSVFYLDVETMKLIMKIEGHESLERLLWIICECHELADMHLRTDERRTLNTLNRNNAAATIRFPMKGKISTRQMKLSCIIQSILGCLPIPDPSLNQEAMKIMRIADRICKCLVAYVTRPEPVTLQLQYFSAVLNSIVLAKCIAAHLWENSPYVSKQLKGIGPMFSTLLATAGKVNFMLLEESHPRDLERIMNKGPPAGNVLRKQISLLPKYQVEATPINEKTVSVKLLLLNQAHLAANMDNLTATSTHKSYVIAGDSENHILLLTTFMDKDLISVYDGCMNYEITRKHAFEHKISVHCVSSSIVGIDAQCEYTFTSLMPINSHNANTSSLYFEGNSKEALKKPTNGSDTPKERKRKNNGEEISQSKEKKKRDNALAEKIKLLKESFGRTSTVLKKDLQKTEEMTRNALNNLVYPDHPESYSKAIDMNTISINDEVNFDETHVDVNFPDNDDDILDDAKIDSILSEIETEITKTNSTPKGHSEKRGEFNQKYPSEKHSAMNKINSTAKQNINMRNRANKPGSNKCNYKFLDLLEKNMDLSDDDVIPVKETGFSDAIKQQVEKYIQSSCLAPPAIDLTMTNLYQEPESTRSIVPTVNSMNKTIYDVESNNAVYSYTDFKQPLSMNMSTSTLTVPAETKSPITKIINDELFKNNIENSNTNLNNDNITLSNNIHCTNKPENINKHNDSDCIHEELPEVDVIGHNTKQVSAHVSDISRDTEKYENKAICSITSAERNDNNLSFSNTQPHHSKHCDNNITDVALEIFTEKESPNTDITISNDTEKTCITSTNNETILKLHNDNKNTNSQHGQLHPSHLSPTSVSDELSMLDKINEICLWNQHVKDIDFKQIKSSVAHNGNEKQIPNVSAIGTVFNSSNNDEAKDLGQSLCKQNYTTSNQNEQNNSQFTKNKHKEYENKYTFSAEKVEVQTKYTKDHKIRVIRTLKVDLDVREIVSDYKTESKLSNKTQEVISNKCVKEKPSVTYIDQETFNSLTHNHTEMDNSKESPENNLIADINKNREKTNMIESIQNDDKNESKDSTNELSVKADETSMVQDNAVVMDNTKLDASKPTSNIEEPNKENGISTILQKFGNIIRNKKNEATSSPRIFASTMSNNVRQSTFKPKRPFRITEIQTIDAPIPIIYENKPKPATPSQVGNVVSINANRIEKALEVENQQTLEKIPKTPEKLPYLDLTPCQSPETLLESSLEITEDDFKIDQSMLNPKTLLQNMGTEDITLDIIPPPPEFCNNDIDYSPVNDDFEQLSFSENLNQTLEERLNRSENEQVFPNTANFTPSDEIETWTLDCDDELESSYSAPTQSFTAIRRKLFENYNNHSLNINGTTTKRLSQFKYNRKTTFK